MTPLDKLTEAAAKHIAYVGEPDAAERHVAKLTLAAIQAALPEGCYLGREGVVKVTALCPACDRPALHDHNSVRCDDCQGLWPLLSEFDPILFVITPVEADQ